MADTGNYATRAAALRETAKWIAAVFVGAGAILFSGLSFTNVTKAANTSNWILPVLLSAVPVAAAAFAVRVAASVIAVSPPDTAELLLALGDGRSPARERDQVERLLPATVAIHGSLSNFEARLQVARDEVDKAIRADDKTAPRRLDVLTAYQQLDRLQEGVRDIVLCADYVRVKETYAGARWRFLLAALVATSAAAASGVTAAKAEHAKPTSAPAVEAVKPAPINAPTAVRVFLAHPRSSRPSSTRCVVNGHSALAIGGDYIRPLLLFIHNVGPCRVPFIWAPRTGEVLVVPSTETK